MMVGGGGGGVLLFEAGRGRVVHLGPRGARGLLVGEG